MTCDFNIIIKLLATYTQTHIFIPNTITITSIVENVIIAHMNFCAKKKYTEGARTQFFVGMENGDGLAHDKRKGKKRVSQKKGKLDTIVKFCYPL